MKIAILSLGSMGDTRPCFILSKRLHERGHEVSLIGYQEYAKFAEKSPWLKYLPISGSVEDLMSVIMNDDGFSLSTFLDLPKVLGKDKDEIFDIAYPVCKEADLLLFITYSSACMCYFGEAFKKPYMRVSFWPDAPTVETRNFGWPKYPLFLLKGAYNYYSHCCVAFFTANIQKKAFGSWRKKLGLPPSWKYMLFRRRGGGFEHLFAYSPTIYPRQKGYSEHVHITGYWFDELSKLDYQPSQKLADFLAAGEAPVYIGFGSMTPMLGDKLQSIIDALRESGRRALLAVPEKYCDPKLLPDNVLQLEYVPHEWLFPRVSAVVHHCGAGSVAMGLRFGKPTFGIPFGSDQKDWAEMLCKRGFGPKPVQKKELTREAFLAGLCDLLDNPAYRKNAEDAAEKLKGEDGVGNACDLMEKYQREFVFKG